VFATGNVTGGNLNTGGQICVTGNVTTPATVTAGFFVAGIDNCKGGAGSEGSAADTVESSVLSVRFPGNGSTDVLTSVDVSGI
jgi:hypothetical protein